MIRIGINGFGRIGRTLFKLVSDRANMEVVWVNDVYPLDTMLHLLKYDSVYGAINSNIVKVNENTAIVYGREFHYSREKDIEQIGWSGVDVVIECTGKFKLKEDLENHLKDSVKKVILSVPPADSDIKMVVLGVNEKEITSQDSIVSNASCTTNSAAHLVNIMNQSYHIDSCFITTVHSYTTDQNLHDAPHRDLRRARAAAQSIIPTSTGAAKALTRIFPDLSKVIGGCGIRVPVPNGSLTDLTFILEKAPAVEEINALVKSYAESSLNRILEYTTDPIVSRDVIGNTHSCVFDSELTSVVGNMVKLVGWYDNEMGYSSRLVDLIDYTWSL